MGCADFVHILVESELDIEALTAGAFHYSSLVRGAVGKGAGGGVKEVPMKYEMEFLQLLAGSGMEAFGAGAVPVSMAAMRLKQVEAISASIMSESRTSLRPDLLQRLLLTQAPDWRALAIRAGASLYRLQMLDKYAAVTPGGRTPEQIKAARTALRVFAPLAHRLGMHKLKAALEGRAFERLYPRQHRRVTEILERNEVTAGEEAVLDEVTRGIKEAVMDAPELLGNIETLKVERRMKEPYSLWRKMIKVRGFRSLPEETSVFKIVPDAMAVRVVLDAKCVKGEPEPGARERERDLCRLAHKVIMTKYPNPSGDFRVKDYIRQPKGNGYESLHATCANRWHGMNWPFEVQVRTSAMHRVAEFGLAAHWAYKAGDDEGERRPTDTMMSYLHGIREWQERQAVKTAKGGDEGGYVQSFTLDQMALMRESVFVFLLAEDDDTEADSEGELLQLPVGSLMKDAIRAHFPGKIRGEQKLWVEVDGVHYELMCNGEVVDLDHVVSNGDVLELVVA